MNDKVDNLFIIIGEVDTHNVTCVKMLLENNGIVHLVYTTQTKYKADLLKAALAKLNITVKPVELGDSSADGYKIRNKIKEKIKPLAGRIGIDYTNVANYVAAHIMACATEVELDFNTELPLLMCVHKGKMLIENDRNRKTFSTPIEEEMIVETPNQEKKEKWVSPPNRDSTGNRVRPY